MLLVRPGGADASPVLTADARRVHLASRRAITAPRPSAAAPAHGSCTPRSSAPRRTASGYVALRPGQWTPCGRAGPATVEVPMEILVPQVWLPGALPGAGQGDGRARSLHEAIPFSIAQPDSGRTTHDGRRASGRGTAPRGWTGSRWTSPTWPWSSPGCAAGRAGLLPVAASSEGGSRAAGWPRASWPAVAEHEATDSASAPPRIPRRAGGAQPHGGDVPGGVLEGVPRQRGRGRVGSPPRPPFARLTRR